jgi:hypothetical protein
MSMKVEAVNEKFSDSRTLAFEPLCKWFTSDILPMKQPPLI